MSVRLALRLNLELICGVPVFRVSTIILVSVACLCSVKAIIHAFHFLNECFLFFTENFEYICFPVLCMPNINAGNDE
jgi:hypothetical protein